MEKKELESRLRELGIYSEYYHRLELKTLAAVLSLGESLNCIFTGYWDGSRKMVAVTSGRLIIIGSSALSGSNVLIVPRSRIKAWQFVRRFLFSSVAIETDEGKSYVFRQTQAGREKLFNWAMGLPIEEYDE